MGRHHITQLLIDTIAHMYCRLVYTLNHRSSPASELIKIQGASSSDTERESQRDSDKNYGATDSSLGGTTFEAVSS